MNLIEDEESCVQAMLFSNTFVFPTVLKAAIDLNLFVIMAEAGDGAYVSPSEIASRLPTRNPNAASLVDRMLRLFASHGLLSLTLSTFEDGSVERLYGLTPTCRLFLRIYTQDRAAWEVCLNMKDAVLEGGNLFERVHGMNFYEYKEKNPARNKSFNEAMVAWSTVIMKEIVEIYKGFEGLASLVDVGGGTGASLNMIISMYPSIKGINFDLPHVVQAAPTYPGIEHVGGSMLVSIPKADAIMMKNVCHNWRDEDCLKILSNCYQALSENGKVIVIELVVPDAPDSSMGSQYATQMDNAMIMLLDGKERTAREFEILCKNSGFSNFRVVCCAYSCLSTIMEFHK